MADIRQAMQAKSDQLNSVDIIGFEPVIRVREVQVRGGEQPVSIYFDGDNNRPWKPSKGMIRILSAGWGYESDQWIGRSVQIFNEPTVKYAGKEVGGVHIRAMSDIPTKGINTTLVKNRQQREPYKVSFLNVERPVYPVQQFESMFKQMADAMESGKMTLNQIVAQCQKTGDLSIEQLKRLEDAAPIEDGE